MEQVHSVADPVEAEGKIGKLISGGDPARIVLDGTPFLTLEYEDRAPSTRSTPLLRLSVKDDFRTYLVPIYFLKTLPVGVVWTAVEQRRSAPPESALSVTASSPEKGLEGDIEKTKNPLILTPWVKGLALVTGAAVLAAILRKIRRKK